MQKERKKCITKIMYMNMDYLISHEVKNKN